MSIPIRPLDNRVILERLESEEKTKGGIVIPDSAKEKPVRGKIIAVGKGKLLDNGEIRALEVKVGDEVLFGKYAGTEVRIHEKDYLVMREEDIIGIVV